MPALTKPQFRAMAAAREGHSKLGIPAKVGKEFVEATPNPKALPAKHKGQYHLKKGKR